MLSRLIKAANPPKSIAANPKSLADWSPSGRLTSKSDFHLARSGQCFMVCLGGWKLAHMIYIYICVYTSIHLYLYTMSRPKTFAKMSRLGWAFLCWADLLHISTIHWYAVLSFAPWNLTWTRKNKQPLRSHSHFSGSSWSYLRLKSPCPRRTVKTPQPHNLSVFSTNPCAGKKEQKLHSNWSWLVRFEIFNQEKWRFFPLYENKNWQHTLEIWKKLAEIANFFSSAKGPPVMTPAFWYSPTRFSKKLVLPCKEIISILSHCDPKMIQHKQLVADAI